MPMWLDIYFINGFHRDAKNRLNDSPFKFHPQPYFFIWFGSWARMRIRRTAYFSLFRVSRSILELINFATRARVSVEFAFIEIVLWLEMCVYIFFSFNRMARNKIWENQWRLYLLSDLSHFFLRIDWNFGIASKRKRSNSPSAICCRLTRRAWWTL